MTTYAFLGDDEVRVLTYDRLTGVTKLVAVIKDGKINRTECHEKTFALEVSVPNGALELHVDEIRL